MPRFRRKRVKPSAITLADRARDAGQWEVAAEYYRGALRRKPENPPIWVQYGHALKESGRLAEAEKAYRTALAYDPRNADSHLQLGHVLKIQGKKEEAQTAYLRAVALGSSLNPASLEFAQLGWSQAHISMLRGMFDPNVPDPIALQGVDGASPDPRARSKPNMVDIDPSATLIHDQVLLDFIRYPNRPLTVESGTFDPNALSIHWVIPEFGAGGGGHMNIFRIVRWLELFGHKCVLWVHDAKEHLNKEKAYNDAVKYYQIVCAEIHPISTAFFETEGDVVIATGWQTVQVVSHAQRFKERFYFVQDYETSFYGRGTYSILAEMTYSKDLSCICGGPWLTRVMEERYGRWARHFWQAADDLIYYSAESASTANELPRIAFYSRVGTPRRAVELGLLALQHLAFRGVRFHVDFFGEKLNFRTTPFSCKDHGVQSGEQLAALYRAADIGMCFSATNYSIVPQEMMACGLPVVELDVESARAIFPDNVVTFCSPNPLEMAETIALLLRDPDRRQRQAKAAKVWVSQFSWEKSARLVEAAICERLAKSGHKKRAAFRAASSRAVRPKASVFIPTYNGGEVFKEVIGAVLRQRAPWHFEVVVIDSSSTDGTDEFCRSIDGLVFEQIPQSAFSHGGTRNRAVELAHGDFVAFLTQDAMPVHEFWLYNIVTVLDAYPKSAGAFGRHVAWPDASPFTKRDIAEHFKQFDAGPIAASKETDPGRWASGDVAWLQFLHFYSDNNSCLRRSVWRENRFPNVDFGEDQLWARRVIELGFEKIYVSAAPVYHSHDYEYDNLFARAETEAIFYKERFGYELAKTREECESQIARLNEADRQWATEHDVAEHELAERLSRNRARVEGYLSGCTRVKRNRKRGIINS
jgi:glycosyltransferase involved in cell wall biosynthesis